MDPSNVISVLFYPGDDCNVVHSVTSADAVIAGYTWNLTVKFDSTKEAAFASLHCLHAGSVKATVAAYRSYFSNNHVLLEGPEERTFSSDSSYEICVRNLNNLCVMLTVSISVAKARDTAVVVDQPYADVVLNVDGAKFHCNRGFLSAVSPVLGAMFNEDFKEKDQPEVTVGDVDVASFGTFLMAIHPEKPIAVTCKPHICFTCLITSVPAANVAMIARLADRYRVSSLLVRCVILLQNDDAISNIHKLLLLDELTQIDALDKSIMRLSPSEVKQAANDERFLALSKECMQKLLQHNTRDA
ncbi:BTB/POZ domain-containing protein [Aphelenchoides avenae]|nr:BTB/POZ domain-containing protein [Aphelenchus avenae]